MSDAQLTSYNRRWLRLLAGVVIVLALLGLITAGCARSQSPETTAAVEEVDAGGGEADTTAPPEDADTTATTQGEATEDDADDAAPEAEEPAASEPTTTAAASASSDEDEGVPVWAWIGAGLLLIAALVWMATRNGVPHGADEASNDPPPA